MPARPSLEVDLGDPDSVRATIKSIDAAIKDHRAAIKAAVDAGEAAIKELERYRQALLLAAGGTEQRRRRTPTLRSGDAGSYDRASVAAQAEAAVAEAAAPVTATDVLALLPEGTKRETVNWALWNAAQNRRIQKLEQGVYAPLGYQRAQIA